MRTKKETEYLLKAIDASDNRFIIISPEFKILAANNYTCTGKGRNSLGKECYRVFYSRQSPCENCPAVKTLGTLEPTLWFQRDSFDREITRSRVYAYPIFSEGSFDAIAVAHFERPTREEMEEELQRSNAFLRNLILSAVDGVIAADMTGKILIFNDAAAEISGYCVEEALETLDIRQFYPDDGAREVMRKLRSDDYGGKGKLKSCQVDVLRKKGEVIPIILNAAIVYEGESEVASIGFFHDMREELRMKGELERTQIQLLQAEKMSSLGKLSAGVAHQINNPLGGITLFAKLILEEYNLPEGAKEDLNRILQDAQRCSDTVKALLEFSRQTSHLIRPQDMNGAISRAMFLLENQALFQNIEIEKRFAADLPKVPVDIQQMNHVFMNIILNAAQAMEGIGKLLLKTELTEDKERVRIEISDTGPGMPEDVLNHIFEPFFTTKEEGKGTGLGLSMVYGIIEDHGGTVGVRSKVGEGTTFFIELPLTRDDKEGEGRGE